MRATSVRRSLRTARRRPPRARRSWGPGFIPPTRWAAPTSSTTRATPRSPSRCATCSAAHRRRRSTCTWGCRTPRRRSACTTGSAGTCRCSSGSPPTHPGGSAATRGSPARAGHSCGPIRAAASHRRSTPGTSTRSTWRRVADAGGPSDYTLVWWDIRPHPRFGTVEIRELDAQAALDDSVALAALTQALARREAEAPAADLPPAEAIGWSCFRAARDGLEAEVLHEGRLTPVSAAARDLAAELDLPELEELVARGGGARRRRDAHARGGTEEMLRDLVAETADPA